MFALNPTRVAARAATRAMSTSAEVTTLSNGVKVVSEASTSGIASLSVTVSGGSMYETSQNAGISHYLRNLAFQSTPSRTAIRIAREAENTGTQYSAESGRDFIQYNAQGLSKHADYFADVLTEVAGSSMLEDWEVPKQNDRVAQDLALVSKNDEVALVDDLHNAAFWGSPLARSPLCLASRVGSLTGADARAFRDAQFAASTTVVAGVGIDHATLVAAAEKNLSGLTSSTPSIAAPVFSSGEVFTPTASSNASVILGVATKGLSSSSDIVSSLVLRQLLGGNGSSVKWADDANVSKIGAIVAASTSSPFSVSGFAANYKSVGIAGTHIQTSGDDAAKAVPAAANAFKEIVSGLGFSDEDFQAAKRRAQYELLTETQADAAQALASQHFYGTDSSASLLAALNNLTKEQFGASIKSDAFVLAARGSIDGVPRLSQL